MRLLSQPGQGHKFNSLPLNYSTAFWLSQLDCLLLDSQLVDKRYLWRLRVQCYRRRLDGQAHTKRWRIVVDSGHFMVLARLKTLAVLLIIIRCSQKLCFDSFIPVIKRDERIYKRRSDRVGYLHQYVLAKAKRKWHRFHSWNRLNFA